VGLEHLLHALERQTAEAASAELETARAEAARIARQAAETFAGRLKSGLDEEESVFRADAERAINAARRSGRRQVLEARQRLLDRIFARAGEMVAEPDGSAQAELVAQDVRRAEGYLGDRPAVARCAPRLVEPLRALLGDTDGLAVEPDPEVRAGFRLQARDGSVLVDRTAARQLADLRARLAIELLRRIGAPS
jgi:vacuolar-type H+-ATPase subunit E/Vma4